MPDLLLRFLGTGAAGGTPGSGKSRRTESSAVATDQLTRILIDVTGDFEKQSRSLDGCDAVLLTHGHSDAIGGLSALHRWGGERPNPIPVYATSETISAVRRRFAKLDHCEFRSFPARSRARIGRWTVTCREVPHAKEPARFPTVAWKMTQSGVTLVYASDVASPVQDLRRFAGDADLLVIDGATYRRRIFSHLRIDEDLPVICGWPVERILLTQIGRSAPAQEVLTGLVSDLCDRASPAYDGLEVALGGET